MDSADLTGVPLPEARPTIASVEIGDWAGLGQNVRLDLGERRTVLVGRNGAGKSLLVAGIFRGAREVWWATPHRVESPAYFRCDVRRPDLPSLSYEYRRGLDDDDDEGTDNAGVGEGPSSGPPHVRAVQWSERCWEPEADTEVWRVFGGALSVRGEESTPISPGVGLLAVMDPGTTPPPPGEAMLLWSLLGGFALIPAGVPRSDPANRREVYVRSPRGGGGRRWARSPGRIDGLAFTIANLFEHRKEIYEEFVGLARRLGIVRDLVVKVYEDPMRTTKPEERRDFASILFDGLNIGLLSDGTLRISEMLVDLIRPTGSVVLIEEPETAVHPGLLARLLDVIDTYSIDRQVVVSTHSPIVVDWCSADELRLIERVDQKTVARSLSAGDAARVASYLCDEGTLSEFIYTRASG